MKSYNRTEPMCSLLIALLSGGGCSGEAASHDQPIGGDATVAADAAADARAGNDSRDAGADGSNGASDLPQLQLAPLTAELWVSRIDGTTMWWRPGSTGPIALRNGIAGPGFGMAFDASSNLYVTHGFTPDLEGGNTIEIFDALGETAGSFGQGYDCNPHSMTFDSTGRAYVGLADCAADILLLDKSGVLLDTFDVVTEARGADWVALAPDRCTIFYTSQGQNVKRYDVCTRTQLDDFNVVPLPQNVTQGSGAQELKLLPGGSVLVANFTEIVLLDDRGVLSRVYDVAGPDGWRGLDLEPSGTSFWATNYSTSEVVRFDVASGEVLERVNSGAPPLTLKSVIVRRP